MKTLDSKELFYAFSADAKPLMTVEQGESFVLETRDCFSNQLCSDEDTVDTLDWNDINPATGPVEIQGVRTGDVVRFDIEKLEMTGKSVMITLPGSGALGGISQTTTRVLDNEDGVLTLPTEKGVLKLPLKPMIGVIGVSPAEGSIPTGTPDTHGGNMDCTKIGQGASLFLKAAVDGAMFGCGDVHALMGDGEVLVCGAETPARVTVSARAIAARELPTPFLETEDQYIAIASAETVDKATEDATENMFRFLTDIAGLSEGDAGRLMTLVGNVMICQIVDPQKTARFEFPKAVLAELGFAGIE